MMLQFRPCPKEAGNEKRDNKTIMKLLLVRYLPIQLTGMSLYANQPSWATSWSNSP